MLEDWNTAHKATPKPALSLVDDWAVLTVKPKSEETQAKASAPALLDQWSAPAPPGSKTVAEQVPSMIDE
jgi:hypothetical protein